MKYFQYKRLNKKIPLLLTGLNSFMVWSDPLLKPINRSSFFTQCFSLTIQTNLKGVHLYFFAHHLLQNMPYLYLLACIYIWHYIVPSECSGMTVSKFSPVVQLLLKTWFSSQMFFFDIFGVILRWSTLKSVYCFPGTNDHLIWLP